MKVATTSSDNIGIGPNSLFNLISGSKNIGIGTRSLYWINSQSDNTCVGYLAGSNLNSTSIAGPTGVTGSNNIFIPNGSGNTLIGSQAGSSLVTGADNIIISSAGTANNQVSTYSGIYIGNAGSNSETGTIAIGTSGYHFKCLIAGINGSTITPSGGPVYINANGQLGTISSSERVKNNINNLSIDISKKIYDMRVVSFYYNEDTENQIQYGMIAEEMVEIMPEIVLRDNDDKNGIPRGIQYHLIEPLMIKELQEHQVKLDAMPLHQSCSFATHKISLNSGIITKMSSRDTFTDSSLLNIKFELNGNLATLHIPSMTLSEIEGIASTINIFTDMNPIPSNFIPNEVIEFTFTFVELGERQTGLVVINNSTLTISKIDGSAIKAGFTTRGITLTYMVK